MEYNIDPWMIEEAEQYAILSAPHTSNRHDFHKGGVSEKALKMFEGKLGEKVFKLWLMQQGLGFDEDKTSHEDADLFDFRVSGRTIDVKTFTKDFHRRLLEMVEQYRNKPKDYYVAIRLRFEPFSVHVKNGAIVFDFSHVTHCSATIVGWANKEDIGRAPISNFGYLDNYWLWLDKLRNMNSLSAELKSLQHN